MVSLVNGTLSLLSASVWGGPTPLLVSLPPLLPSGSQSRSRYMAVVGCGCMCIGRLSLGKMMWTLHQ